MSEQASKQLGLIVLSINLFFIFQVYDMFPGHDLTTRKDFIKETVRKVSLTYRPFAIRGM